MAETIIITSISCSLQLRLKTNESKIFIQENAAFIHVLIYQGWHRLHSSGTLPWVPEAFHARFPVSSLQSDPREKRGFSTILSEIQFPRSWHDSAHRQESHQDSHLEAKFLSAKHILQQKMKQDLSLVNVRLMQPHN